MPKPDSPHRLAALVGLVVLLAAGAWSSRPGSPIAEAGAADGCAPAPQHLATATAEPVGGVGGTGRDADPGNGGIGGTGRAPASGEGGIGGTGIVGTVTGFASVCVNGVEVHYDATVPVTENGVPSSTRALAVGQVVALDAVAGPRGLTARRIEVVHALEGPVTRNAGGRFEVMGAPVVPADAVQRAGIDALQAGDWVQVAGHRDGAGRWVATRVVAIAPRAEASVQAGVDAADRVGGVRVAGDGLPAGAARLVRGEWQAGADDGRLRIRDAAPAPAAAILGRAERLIVETRVREARDGRVRSGEPEIDGVLAGRALREGDLVRVRAHRDGSGRLVGERVERPDGRGETRPGARRDGGERDPDAAGRDGRDAERERRDVERGQRDAERERRDVERARQESAERAERAERDRVERAERPDRERAERGDRRGRD